MMIKSIVRELMIITGTALLMGCYWGFFESSYVTAHGGINLAGLPILYKSGIMLYLMITLPLGLYVCIIWLIHKAIFSKRLPISSPAAFALIEVIIFASLLPIIHKFSVRYLVNHPFILKTQLNTYLFFFFASTLICGLFAAVIIALLGRMYIWSKIKAFYKLPLALAIIIPALFLFIGLRSSLTSPPSEEPVDTLPPSKQFARTSGTHQSNVILITADALRADHINCYGYTGRRTSPNINALAKSGVLFDNCFAQGGWTKPSIASILCSLYPEQHGCVKYYSALSPRALTLPKILAGQGYSCYGIYTIQNALDPNYGVKLINAKQYNNAARNALVKRGILVGHFLFNKLFFPALDENFGLVFPTAAAASYVLPADQVNTATKSILRQSINEPFFLHIHYHEPHQPYLEHPYRQMQLNMWTAWNRENLLRAYDSQIRFLDNALGALFFELRTSGLADRTIVVFSSDHGEEFLEHGGWSHSRTLYNEILHVPLIIKAPGLFPKGLHVEQYVRSIDIAPTILDLLGIKRPSSLEGKSLLPLIRGDEKNDRVVIAQMINPTSSLNIIMKNKFKYISRILSRTGKIKHEELYDLKKDFREKENVLYSYPEIAASLKDILKREKRRFKSSALGRGEQILDEETKRELKALGYL